MLFMIALFMLTIGICCWANYSQKVDNEDYRRYLFSLEQLKEKKNERNSVE